jgi:hypothetical protein
MRRLARQTRHETGISRMYPEKGNALMIEAGNFGYWGSLFP